MYTRLAVRQPFASPADMKHRVGEVCYGVLRRLAGQYPRLGTEEKLRCASIAWEMMTMAREGWSPSFLMMADRLWATDSRQCITIEGKPYCVTDTATDHFLWDCFNILIDQEGTSIIAQPYYDEADRHQYRAYGAMGQDSATTWQKQPAKPPVKAPPAKPPGNAEPTANTAATENKVPLDKTTIRIFIDAQKKTANLDQCDHFLLMLYKLNKEYPGLLNDEIVEFEGWIEQSRQNMIGAKTTTNNYYAPIGMYINNVNQVTKNKKDEES